ncbi:MAG TPA: cupin domain-containing protein [Planctomycetaceae bacterium]|jgi:quercetin dioxygenase-like cupin family protein
MTPILSFEPFISTAKESPAYWFLDILWVVHATGEQTQGRYSIIEQRMPHGVGPPPHVHAFEDESFWVMEGEMTAEVGGKTLVLGPRAMGHIPRNTVHAFKVSSKEVCHVLNFYTPAGFEQALVGCARPAVRRELPPPGTRRARLAAGGSVLQQLLDRACRPPVGGAEVWPGCVVIRCVLPGQIGAYRATNGCTFATRQSVQDVSTIVSTIGQKPSIWMRFMDSRSRALTLRKLTQAYVA